MIKKLLAVLCLSAPLWATTTITGNLKNLGTSTVSFGTFVRFYLRGCSGNIPRINGSAVIAPTLGNIYYVDFVPNSAGAISGVVYSTTDATGTGNGDIECGGLKTGLWYGMVPFLNGKAGPETPIAAKNTAVIDISNVTPLTANPVVVSPTGDGTYARLDGGNQPFTGGITAPSLNNNTLTVSPKDQFGNPTVTVLGIGTLKAVNFGASTNNNTNTVFGNDIPASNGGTYTLGAAAVIPVTSCTGTITLNLICEGSQTIGISYGSFVNNGFFQPSITGVEADCQSISTGGLWDNCYGVHAAATEFSGSTNFTYMVALHAANCLNSGSGTVTGCFGVALENQTAGTVHYGIWNKGHHLINNGFTLQWMGALTTTTSATMTGCPGACLVTVTDTAHGYSTNDLIYYQGSNQQYNGFYQITNTGANTFTFPAKAPYPSNASNDGAANIQKLPGSTAPFQMGVTALSETVFSSPFINTSSNGAFQFQVQGNNTMCFKSPFWIIDCAAAGYALEIPSTSGLQFLGGSGADLTGTTGATGNAVTDHSPTIITPTISGKIPTYNSLTTAGQGLVVILGATLQKNETTSADANVLTVTPAAAASNYRVCATISVSAATSGVISWTLSWKDSNSTTQTNIAQPLFQFGTAAPATTFTTSAAGNYMGCSMIDADNSATNIVVKWVGGGTTTAKMSATIERLQ